MWPLVLHVCCAVRSRRQESGQEAATFLPFIHSICPPLKVPAAERKLFASGGLVEDSGACSHTIPPAAQFSTTFSSVLSIPFSYHPNDVVHLYSERQARILVLRTNQPTKTQRRRRGRGRCTPAFGPSLWGAIANLQGFYPHLCLSS